MPLASSSRGYAYGAPVREAVNETRLNGGDIPLDVLCLICKSI
jgi:hypothetical protein